MADPVDSEDTLCPVSRSTGEVGDRWTLRVVRELFMGVSRFRDLQAQTGATPQMLTARLKRLEATGLVTKRPYSTHPPRHEYVLTAKGAGLLPILLAFRSWGERWCKSPDEGLALRTIHRTCGSEVDLDNVCASCARPVAWSEMAVLPTPAYLEERQKRAEAFRVTQPAGGA